MIKSNNTVNIEGSVIDHEELKKYLSIDGVDDAKTKWLVRPLIMICGAGLAIAARFASVFLFAVSLVIVPVLGVAVWAMKSNSTKAETSDTRVAETTVSDAAVTESGTPDPA